MRNDRCWLDASSCGSRIRRVTGARLLRRESGAPRRILAALALAATLALFGPPPAAADGSDGARVSFRFDHAAGRAASRPTALHFRAFGRDFDLSLERNEGLVAPGAKVVWVGGQRDEAALQSEVWIGRLSDDPRAEARLTIDGDRARGYVRTGAGTFVFEPDDAADASAHVVRRAEDVVADGPPIACGADDDVVVAAPPPAASSPSARSERSSYKTLNISAVADAAFYRRFGDQSIDRMLELFNEVDGIYRSELGITLQIVQLVVYRTEESQPFSATAAGGELLSQLSLARENDVAGVLSAGAVTHLLSGRSLSGPSGIAWIAGVCDARYGVGISAILSTPGYLETILVAHELGHNLGASHDGATGYGCEKTPFGWIMWPVLQRDLADEFSDCSRGRIAAQMPIATCIGSAAPLGCGNGELDEGEECDDGNNLPGDCCRADCMFDAAAMPCGISGDVCFDSTCDGAGNCRLVANDAPCSAADACVEARCSDGTCVAGEEPRGFESVSVKFRVGTDGMVRSAKLSGTVAMQQIGSDPCSDGMEIVATLGQSTAYDQYIAADLWREKGVGNYTYKAVAAQPGTVKTAKIRFAPTTGRATFRFTLAAPMSAMSPEPGSVYVLAGGRSDGQCGTSPVMRCLRRGTSYSCS